MFKKRVAITPRPKTVADICELNQHCFALCVYICLYERGQSIRIEDLFDTILLMSKSHEDAVSQHHEKYFKNGKTPMLGLLNGEHQIRDTLIQLDKFSNSLGGGA